MAQLNCSQADSISLAEAERRARLTWVGIIVSFLGVQLIAGVVTIYLAVGDPSVAVIPNYYQSGLNWDVKKRNLDHFHTLGWQIEIDVQSVDVELQQRQIMIHLRSGQQPIGQQRVSASIYHHARGNRVFTPHFDETHPGQYVAICRLVQPGLWQFEILIEGDHGQAEARFSVNVSPTGATTYLYPEGKLPEGER